MKIFMQKIRCRKRLLYGKYWTYIIDEDFNDLVLTYIRSYANSNPSSQRISLNARDIKYIEDISRVGGGGIEFVYE